MDKMDYTFLSYEWVSYKTSEPVSIVAILFFVLVISFGTIGNLLVVVAFCKNPPLRSHSINVFMVQTSLVNLIVSGVINPVYIITIFIDFDDNDDGAGGGGKTTLAVEYANLALMHLANTLSMYSLCAVATNRYLLIASPNTTFRICCFSRRRIAGVLAGLWLAAILTVLPYWAFLYYDLYIFIDSQTAFERLTIVGYVLNSVWFVPVIIIPIMHLATLRVIRKNRMRIEGVRSDGAKDMQRNEFILDAEQVRQQGNGLQEPTALDYVDENDDTELSKGSETGKANAGTATVEAATTSAAAVADGELGAESKTCCSGFCWTKQDALNVKPQRNRSLAASEMRLLKMMFLMYTILIVSLVPAVLSFTPIVKTGSASFLVLFGYAIPIYPALMPYIFLWTNKNFRSAVAKIIQNMRMRTGGQVGSH